MSWESFLQSGELKSLNIVKLLDLKGNCDLFQPYVFPINVTIVSLGNANFALTSSDIEIRGNKDSRKTM